MGGLRTLKGGTIEAASHKHRHPQATSFVVAGPIFVIPGPNSVIPGLVPGTNRRTAGRATPKPPFRHGRAPTRPSPSTPPPETLPTAMTTPT